MMRTVLDTIYLATLFLVMISSILLFLTSAVAAVSLLLLGIIRLYEGNHQLSALCFGAAIGSAVLALILKSACDWIVSQPTPDIVSPKGTR